MTGFFIPPLAFEALVLLKFFHLAPKLKFSEIT
jgi:hypothetical protein